MAEVFPKEGIAQKELLRLQIKAEETAGMYIPRDHANQFLPRVWDHPEDGKKPIPMGPGRRYKLEVLRFLLNKLDTTQR